MPSSLTAFHRLVAVLFLGFASGLPLALTGQAMQAWLTVDGVDIATIGFLGLVGSALYTFKFLWAPLMDRFEPPWLGRRRGWLVLTQLALAACCGGWPACRRPRRRCCSPPRRWRVAFLSASQDVVIDAYRTDVLDPRERGWASSMSVFGYRLAMILSGGIALIWAEQWGSWGEVYRVMAGIMAGRGGGFAARPAACQRRSKPLDSDPGGNCWASWPCWPACWPGRSFGRWLLIGLGLDPTTPTSGSSSCSCWPASPAPCPWGPGRRAGPASRPSTVPGPASSAARAPGLPAADRALQAGRRLRRQPDHALPDQGHGLHPGGGGHRQQDHRHLAHHLRRHRGRALMLRLACTRPCWPSACCNCCPTSASTPWRCWARAPGAASPCPLRPGLRVALDKPAEIDGLLMAAIAFENITSGMGTAAFVALLMGLCSQQFTATHYALLSALAAVGRIYVSPLSGVLSEASAGRPSSCSRWRRPSRGSTWSGTCAGPSNR
jgi:PAT family beta-lactamase induction signal transducer AmpG